ncbi:glucuronate isomerase [uncultured Dubosiella sp.]|uniref:glucuronate isomerase n=2 Tax=uncultured Dubosiella sp. TaxID=1937011 RepID=UPI00208B0CE7|nr:glucuronate isomerase [uncultured Dubosiella sp.]GJM57987.1 uronate isomerase [Erysipelotrichaceae bacterium OPF54]
MKKFMDKDFLLETDTAKELFHNYAEVVPVLDYHCHINPQEIYEDRKFDNIAQVWLGGDHYKWRQMRSNGIDEYYITGDASDWEKFEKYAQTLDKAIGNPLYHWSHLELQRFFDYDGVLSSKTAKEVWDLCNEKLSHDDMSVRNLIKKANVTLICTTDDPIDDLKWHKLIKEDDSFDVQVLPAWRPDKAVNINKPDFMEYVGKLADAAQMEINTFEDLKKALANRMDFFAEKGCSVADHGLDYVMYVPASDDEIEAIFAKKRNGEELTNEEVVKFKTAIMLFLAKENKNRNWVMQLHYGCKRDNNTVMFDKLGPDTGYDCISNEAPGSQLADFLNAVNMDGGLPKTIIYSLNPGDDELIGTILGCFQNSDAIGKIQQGSAWWFNDNKTGMQKQMTSLANLGLLGNFVGMLTDSRSFLSYPRHEYFRRIMCNLIGGWVENGEFPYDMDLLAPIVKGISYNNAIDYFNFDLEKK